MAVKRKAKEETNGNSGYMRIREAAEFLAVSCELIVKLIRSGILPSAKLGDYKRSPRRIPRQAIVEYAERRTSRKWMGTK